MQCVSQLNTQGYLVQALRFLPLGYSSSINLLRLSELHLIAAFPSEASPMPLSRQSTLVKNWGHYRAHPTSLLPPPTSRDS